MKIIIFALSIILLNASPLQDATDQSANFISNILGAFQGTKALNLTQFLQSFEMPTCMRRCLPKIGVVSSLFDKPQEAKALKSLCDNLKESTQCATMAGCDHVFMDALSESFKFMCIENLDKISEHFTCIEQASGDLQQDCENTCAVQADVIDKASKNKADQIFSMENMCNSTTCLVDCYRTNLERRCNIGENNIIEVILSGVAKGEKNGYEQIMGWVLPDGCKDSEGLKLNIPKKITIDTEKPRNVGKSVSAASDTPKTIVENIPEPLNDAQKLLDFSDDTENSTTMGVETAILVDGKVQTLQCKMLDWQKNPIETPDFESLAKLIQEKFSQYSIVKNVTTDQEKPTKKVKKSLVDNIPKVKANSSWNAAHNCIMFVTFICLIVISY